jgi:hypothetical protein
MIRSERKVNAARRHHIPKQKRKVTNWAAHDASLRQRGRLTVRFTNEAIAAWPARRVGQVRTSSSDDCIKA